MGILKRLFMNKNDKELSILNKQVDKIDKYSSKYSNTSLDEIKIRINEIKTELANGKDIEEYKYELFAIIREVSKLVTGLYPFKVQLVGALVINDGRIAEMQTGEGKTLASAFPAIYHALKNERVYIVTANEYLAKRDADNLGRIFSVFGLATGVITSDTKLADRKEIYKCNIVYGTVSEFGFDYLRDNMQLLPELRVQFGKVYAIIDEVDSILIDEARTPLIISGNGVDISEKCRMADTLVKMMKGLKVKEVDSSEDTDDLGVDYVVDEKHGSIIITDKGYNRISKYYKIDKFEDQEYYDAIRYVTLAIRANEQLYKDKDYIIENGKIVIVDEFTGRLLYGRQYNAGLHQAVEAKEGLEINKDSMTLAYITIQNYFRQLDMISGMTGTASTEETEFNEIYGMDVVKIPTNLPMIRVDHPDILYKTVAEKYEAIANKIAELNKKEQPVLVGTTSVEKSEIISKLLTEKGIKHKVLNAKNHYDEARIIAQAGKLGSVTISTNMAGRGTDIILGGNYIWELEDKVRNFDYTPLIQELYSGNIDEYNRDLAEIKRIQLDEIKTKKNNKLAVKIGMNLNKFEEEAKVEHEKNKAKVINAGGLFVLGTERHESRRIDNQLIGRSGRQGDIGESQFTISMDDNLLRLFGVNKLDALVGDKSGIELSSMIMTTMIETAQHSVESINFKTRKTLLAYDNVLNEHRLFMYKQRLDILKSDSLVNMLSGYIEEYIDSKFDSLDIMGSIASNKVLEAIFENDLFEQGSPDPVDDFYKAKGKIITAKFKGVDGLVINDFVRRLFVNNMDTFWAEHIDNMDELRKGMSLRVYSGSDPISEYKKEGDELFNEMLGNIKNSIVEQFILIDYTFEKIDVQDNK